MKTLLATLALLVAAPAAAQTAPAAPDPHAAHRQHSGEHKDHGKAHGDAAAHKDCCKDGKMDCCAKMKAKDAADCCKDKEAAKTQPQDAHAGHDH